MMRRYYSWCLCIALVICGAVSSASVLAQSGTYLTVEGFHQRAFGDQTPEQGTLWLNGQQKEVAHKILGHNFHRLRVRYWHHQDRSAWVLEEIGKERPITLGVVVENNSIVEFVVLEFRESRGGEIRHSFFTQQFQGLSLKQNVNQATSEKLELDGHVDGITGATLSVRATRKIATLALFFHQQVFHQGEMVNEAKSGQDHDTKR